MYQNGGGMAQFGQMGLNQFSQMQSPQAGGGGMMMPMMMPQMYGQPFYPQQMMMPMMPQQMPMNNNSMVNNNQSQQFENQDDANQQKQFDQNQGNNNQESMGRRNMSQPNMAINQPISKPSEGFTAQDRYGKSNKQKEYAQMLEFQIDLKKKKQDQLKSIEQMTIENLKNQRIKSQVFASQGQIQRDEYGNIINSKQNPLNPNYQPLDWFSHMAHKDAYQNPMNLGQQSQQNSLANIPDLSIFDPDLKRQRELGQRLQTAKSQLFNQNQDKIMRAQEQFENAVPQQQFDRPQQQPQMNIGGDVDLIKMRKRQQALELQREQVQQIEEKKRQKQLRSIQETRERDLEDLKVQREIEELNKRMQGDFNDSKLGNRNLQQTNFNLNNTNNVRRSMENIEISNGGSQSQLINEVQIQPPTIKSSMKRTVIKTPPDDYNDDYNRNVRIEQRIVRELPIEITTTVKETVNNELMRLRNEMQMQSNSLGEQILGMKSQLMKANERRSQAETDVQKLREELKKTQVIDEIRQRELYNAFVLTNHPKIHSNPNTDKIYDADFKFELPTRPKPYYNMQDPYLDNYNKDFEKDNHGILSDQTKFIPVGEYDYSANAISNKQKMDDQFLIDKEEFNNLEKRAYHMETDQLLDLPDDYLNKQNLYYAKTPGLTKDNDDDINDYKDYMIKNQNRLDKLDEINILETKGELDKLDSALFDLASHSNQESRFKKRYEQEENLQDIEDFISFQTKINRYN